MSNSVNELGPCRNCMLRPAVAHHHIEPRSLAPDRVEDPTNIISLCMECHEWAESAGEAGRIILREKKRRQLYKDLSNEGFKILGS